MEEEHEEKLTQLLDTFVIRLEGGSQEDAAAFISGQAGTEGDDAASDPPLRSPRTASIFFKALPPSVTRAEMAQLCSRYPGFLRVALAEPPGAGADRRWARRGWATFQRGTKVREICFSLNGTKLRGWDLTPVLNKDLTKRIRAGAITADNKEGVSVSLHDRRHVRGDLKLVTRLVASLDNRRGLWQPEEGTAADGAASGEATAAAVEAAAAGAAVLGGNPLLKSVQDYLVEEVRTGMCICT